MISQKRLPLLVGLAIPAGMIVLVTASIYLPRLLVRPPRVNFLYSLSGYGQNQFTVQGGELTRVPPQPGESALTNNQHLFIYDVQRNTSREVSFGEAQRLHLDTSPTSPDGFRLVTSSGGGDALFFFYNPSEPAEFLKGHGLSVKLDLQTTQSATPLNFIGWIE